MKISEIMKNCTITESIIKKKEKKTIEKLKMRDNSVFVDSFLLTKTTIT